MEETYIKINWKEENTIFYLHFSEENAIEQIEVNNKGVFITSLKNPLNDESMLYDQDLCELDIDMYSLISEKEFLEKKEFYSKESL